MEKASSLLVFELLRDAFMISEDAIGIYSHAATDYLAGKEITDFFGFTKLTLPDVPDTVALIPMAGVLTKADVCGGLGSRTLAAMIDAAAKDPAIESILIFSENCPGGQVDGTMVMAESIQAARQIKPVMGVVSGMACSAAIWVLSQCSEIFATSGTDQVGCIGVMAKMKNPKLIKEGEQEYITLYSDHSPDKNAEFRDPELMKKAYLNPVAKLFQQQVMAGRGSRLQMEKEDVLTGKTYIARDAKNAGLIDGILSFNKILSRSQFLSKHKN